MPIGNQAVVPHPQGLLNGVSPAYLQRKGYLNTTTGAVEGDRLEIKLYNGRGSATVAGGVYRVIFDGDEETNPAVATATAQTVDQWYVVSIRAVADATWDWYAIEGYVDALVEGTTDVAKDDTLKVVVGTAANAFVQDTASGVISSDTIAIACAAQAANSSVLTKVYLYGREADID